VARTLTTLYHLNSERLRERRQFDTAERLPWGDTDFIDPDSHTQLGLIWQLLRRASGYDVIVLNGSGRRDQLAASLLRRLRPKVRLVLTDCTWKVEDSRAAHSLTRIGIWLMDGPRTHYCVLSSTEKELFPSTWGVDAERVFFTPWYFWLSVEEARLPTPEQGFVFSGGDSLRDYRPLIEAAPTLPVEIRIAAHRAPPVSESEMPPNVTFAPLPPEQYFETMCEASVVVVALEADSERSAGQNSYLNPMAKGKLVVINDTTGVRDYVSDGETALIVPNHDPASLADAVKWALDPSNAEEARKIVRRAQRDVTDRFPLGRYVAQLIQIADRVTAGQVPSGAD
jgi:glycosyltransferase involved in cell wall biosynthesis